MQVSAGAGIEAIVFGLFGFKPQVDGCLDVHPYYAHELGTATLSDYRFRGHQYDISMNHYGFKLSRDGILLGSYEHGQSVRIWPDGRTMMHKEMKTSIPVADTDNFIFVDSKDVVLKTATSGAQIFWTVKYQRSIFNV